MPALLIPQRAKAIETPTRYLISARRVEELMAERHSRKEPAEICRKILAPSPPVG
jgi:hypothetical protein